ncbi:MAG: diguanylate cyclase [Sterolibacterium sp.]|nr:diguanylate cyclase [Sterolibacterium sp.]
MSSYPLKHNPFFAQWLVLGVALLLLGGVAGYDLYLERGRIQRQEEERLLAMARVIQENVEHNLDSVNQALEDLRKELPARLPDTNLNQQLKTLTDAMPSVRTININDATGAIQASNRAELVGKNLNFNQREYFKAPFQHPDAAMLFVSPPFRTTLGVFSIVVTRMIPGPKGEFVGVIAAGLDPQYFEPLLDSVRYAPDMVVSLHHGDGILYMILPHERDGLVGRNLAVPGSPFTLHKESGQAATVFSVKMLASGEERMLAQRTIQPARLKMDKSLGVAVSRLLDDIYAPWLHDVQVKVGLFVLTSLALSLGLIAYQRRQRQFFLKESETAKAIAASEQFMRVLTDNIPGMVGYWTSELRCRFANKAYLEWFGKTVEQMRDIRIQDLMGETLFRKNEPYMRAALRGERQDFERTLIKADGSTGYTWAHYIPDMDGKQVKGFFVLVSDITQLKQAEMALAQSEWKLKTIIETAPECVKVLAPDGTLRQMNRAGLEMIEADTEEQVVGAKMADIVASEYRAAFIALNERVNQGEAGTLEFEIVGLKGGHHWLDTHAVPVRDVNGQIMGLLGVTRDITEHKQVLQELERLSQTDSLTSLANRRHFMTLAEQELSRALRYGGPLSLFMMDIDHFKNINDTYGHQTGDQVLQRLGALCLETLRDIDSVGRIGGEEFAVVLPHTDGEHALEVAERLRQTIARAEVVLEHSLPLSFTVSIGVTTLLGASANIDTLIGQADSALYQAKRAGRNRVWVFGNSNG